MTSIRLVTGRPPPAGAAAEAAPALGRRPERDDVERLLGTARTFAASLERHVKKLPTLKGHLVVNLFYESSTRTSSSFELAAKRLSADTLNVKSPAPRWTRASRSRTRRSRSAPTTPT